MIMGILRVKPGVVFTPQLPPAGARILEVLKRATQSYGVDVTITSAADGVHSGPTDPHYTGEAFDLRTHDLTAAQKSRLLNDLWAGLYREPRQFYAFLEAPNTPNEHIHVQRRNGVIYTMLDYLRDV